MEGELGTSGGGKEKSTMEECCKEGKNDVVNGDFGLCGFSVEITTRCCDSREEYGKRHLRID